MKNYKYLIPIMLIALMVLSVFSTIKEGVNQKTEYDNSLKQAREAAELGIIEDAVSNYMKVLELKPSVDVAVELGETYVAQNWLNEAISWGEDVVEEFPDEAKAYSFLMERYIAVEDFEECFKLLDMADAKDVSNKELKELASKIEYIYEYGREDFDSVSVFSSGYCAVEEDGVWGYADLNGNTVIQPQFSWAGVFTTDQVAPIKSAEGEYYYISTNGNKKIVPQNIDKCVDIGASIDKIIPASDNGDYGYYNHEFEKIMDQTYTYATVMNGNVAAVQEIDQWYIVDGLGNKQEKSYESVVTDEKGIIYRNDRIFVEDGNKVFMIDKEGKEIGIETYDDAKLFAQADSYAAVKKGNKWGFIDKTGEMVIDLQYADARSFSNGYAAVEKNGKWGFINTKGDLIIDYRFDDARDFNENGNVFVKTEGKWEILKLIKNNYK